MLASNIIIIDIKENHIERLKVIVEFLEKQHVFLTSRFNRCLKRQLLPSVPTVCFLPNCFDNDPCRQIRTVKIVRFSCAA